MNFHRQITPPAMGTVEVISHEITIPATVAQIRRAFAASVEQVGDVEFLRGATEEETAANIWHYIRENVEYRRDADGDEDIKTARRTMSDGYGDCDDGSVLAAAILYKLGYIPVSYIIAQNGGEYSHIFTCSGDNPRADHSQIRGYAIDFVPEIPGPNRIAPNITKVMALRYLDGVAPAAHTPGTIRGLAGLAAVSSVTSDLMARRDTLIELYQAGIWDDAAARELRITLALIQMNGTPEQVQLLPLVPYIQDITPTGVIAWKDGSPWEEIEMHLSGHTLVGLGKIRKGKDAPAKPKEPGKFLQVVGKFNPLTIAIREALKAVLALNLFRLASRMRWLYIAPSDPMAKGVNPDFLAKFQANRGKVEKAFELLGGDPAALKAAIDKGAAKRDRKSLKGLGVVETVTLATASTGVIALVEAMGGPKALKELAKELTAAKVANDPAAEQDELTADDSPKFGAKAVDFIKNLLKGGDKDNAGTPQESGFQSTEQAQAAYNAATGNKPDTDPEGGKDNTVLYVAGAAGLLLALGLASRSNS